MTAQPNIDIRPTEIDGKHWVDVILDGEMRRHGPFPDADAAEAAAERMLRFGRALRPQVHT
jgi:hypothetical protein